MNCYFCFRPTSHHARVKRRGGSLKPVCILCHQQKSDQILSGRLATFLEAFSLLLKRKKSEAFAWREGQAMVKEK